MDGDIEAARKKRLEKKNSSMLLEQTRKAQWQKDLRGKYTDELFEEAKAEIVKEASKGWNECTVQCHFRDDDGEIITTGVVDKLTKAGFTAEAVTNHVPEYQQLDHFDEGDYSHRAYDSWHVKISWRKK